MNIINLTNITKSYTERKLFEKASFYLQENEKVGIIGINGTGKSTLLKIIAGIEEPDDGSVIRANHVVTHYLPQNPEFDSDMTVIEAVLSQTKEAKTGNWNLESDAKAMMTKLGITDFSQKVGELSGGQRKRLALVAALVIPCDVLLLDEPTNHLDAAMSDWLEETLKKWRTTLVMVTHDRYFLDSVCNRIIEVDRGSIYSYDTNYSGYLERKAEREDIAQASERKRQSILRKELEWVRRGARARTTKQKARLQRYEDLKNQTVLEADGNVEMHSVSTRMGKTTVELDHISKAYGDKVLLDDFSYIFLKNDRIGFVGPNGSGKTTLMKMITGAIAPDSGTITVGQTIKIGYYTQEFEQDEKAGIAYMDPNEKVIDYIKNTAEYVRTEEGLVSASSMLERFLFPASMQYSPLGKLSGGEKRRLNLLRVLMESPNVLVLDEPTNDLDTKTLTILEDYLDNYDGIVITVSHDRYFLDRVVRRIFAFEGNGRLRQYEGGYTEYINRVREEGNLEDVAVGLGPGGTRVGGIGAGKKTAGAEQTLAGADAPGGKQDSRATWKQEKKLKFSYKEEREYATIESDIETLEKKLEELDAKMLEVASDFGKLNALTKEKEEVEVQLEEKMERWEYLEDLAQRIANQ